MTEYEFKTLNPMRFMEIVPEREKCFAEASGGLEGNKWQSNELAKLLHPGDRNMVVSKIIEHSRDCRSFILTMEDQTQKPAFFSAGQYVCVRLDINGNILSRPYSISSSPKESLAGYYRISVKKYNQGLATEYIYNNWKEGSIVKVSEPMGFFTYEPLRDSKNIIGVAGGMGITPLLSMAKAICEGTQRHKLTILYGCSGEHAAVFKDELEEICSRTSDVQVRYVYGNITVDDIVNARCSFGDAEDVSVFVCGPGGLYQYIESQSEQILDKLNIEEYKKNKYIRFESFAESRKTCGEMPEYVNFTVKIRDKVMNFKARTDVTILRSLEENAVPALSGCRGGQCGYCRSKLLSGDVYIPEKTDGRRLADSKYSYLHPCCSFPLTDIELEVPSIK